ncbi:MAG TPA: DoxX family protein [Candidatus Saccharimonadales bacterium]|nr:DoxX family protein [Candidatus Saccharimonadales bacterium]
MVKTPLKLSRHIAILRIIFGLLWAVDASFKWLPAFSNSFLDQIRAAGQDQPLWLNPWFHFWDKFLGHDPHLFAILTAVIESYIALALIFGFARRATYLAAAVFSLIIWSVAEGFGGPYSAGSTDIGTAIIYAVVFFALYGLDRLASAPKWAVDNYLGRKFRRWPIIANP